MNCHAEVQPKDGEGRIKPEIAKLLEHWNDAQPIRWNKVNDLADFVYFEHSRHIAAGVTCQQCHGPVATMDHVRREHGQKMNWCLGCHKQPPTNNLKTADPTLTTQAPINCSTCHR